MAARFWVGGNGTWDGSSTANWASVTNGAPGASAPTSADTVTFDSNSGTGTCTTAAGAACSTMTINSSTLAVKLGADLTAASTFTLTLGSLDLNGFVLNATTVVNNNSNTRSIAFGSTGQINLTATSGTLWNASTTTGFTTSGTNKVVTAPNGGAGTRTFNPGSSLSEANAMTFKITSGTDTVSLQGRYLSLDLTGFAGTVAAAGRTIYGSYTIGAGCTFAGGVTTTFSATSGNYTITTNGVTSNESWLFSTPSTATWSCADNVNLGTGNLTFRAGTLKLKAGGTTTINVFATTSSTDQHYLQSTVDGTQATLSQASGTVNVSFLTIKDINATGGATWQALWSNNNVDAGDNTGWVFGDRPVTDVAELTYRLRSFTQPRRF